MNTIESQIIAQKTNAEESDMTLLFRLTHFLVRSQYQYIHILTKNNEPHLQSMLAQPAVDSDRSFTKRVQHFLIYHFREFFIQQLLLSNTDHKRVTEITDNKPIIRNQVIFSVCCKKIYAQQHVLLRAS